MATKILCLDFEVFGRVQGVFFRKHTMKTAKLLGLVGWCKNMPTGTVAGHIEGQTEKIAEMKSWLMTKGSPKSRIEKCDFKNEASIAKLTYKSFDIIS